MIERRPDERSRVAEALAAGAAADCLVDLLARMPSAPSVRFVVEDATVNVPRRAAALLVDLLEDLSEGRDVTIAPADVVVGTTEASRVLGVSRTWTVRLIDDGKLASEVRGSKRRVHLGSLMARRRADIARIRRASEALGENLDLAVPAAGDRYASDVATSAMAAMMASAWHVAPPQPANLEPEHSTYIDALMSASSPPPAGDPGTSFEPTLAA